jgi:hypothetical protein
MNHDQDIGDDLTITKIKQQKPHVSGRAGVFGFVGEWYGGPRQVAIWPKLPQRDGGHIDQSGCPVIYREIRRLLPDTDVPVVIIVGSLDIVSASWPGNRWPYVSIVSTIVE